MNRKSGLLGAAVIAAVVGTGMLIFSHQPTHRVALSTSPEVTDAPYLGTAEAASTRDIYVMGLKAEWKSLEVLKAFPNWTSDVTGNNDGACEAWQEWQKLENMSTEMAHSQIKPEEFGANVVALDNTKKTVAKNLANAVTNGKGAYDCGDGTGHLEVPETAYTALASMGLGPEDANTTAPNLRQAIIRELKPHLDDALRTLRTQKSLTDDQVGSLAGAIDQFHLKASELGVTEAQFKTLTTYGQDTTLQ